MCMCCVCMCLCVCVCVSVFVCVDVFVHSFCFFCLFCFLQSQQIQQWANLFQVHHSVYFCVCVSVFCIYDKTLNNTIENYFSSLCSSVLPLRKTSFSMLSEFNLARFCVRISLPMLNILSTLALDGKTVLQVIKAFNHADRYSTGK